MTAVSKYCPLDDGVRYYMYTKGMEEETLQNYLLLCVGVGGRLENYWPTGITGIQFG